MMQTIPPLESLTIFCMVSCSLIWLSSPIMETLLVMPSLTSCSTVLPKMFVSQMPSLEVSASEIYPIRSCACCCVPTIGAI